MTYVRVGSNTLAEQARRRAAANVYHNTAPWIAPTPTIPAGAYNPTLDIELAAGKRGTNNTLEDLLTRASRGDANYALETGEVHRQEAEQGAQHASALASLAHQYAALGSRQTEGANAAGVGRGSALAQAAVKRALNQARSAEPVNTAYHQQQLADTRALGRLALAHQQEAEDNATAGSRAEREQNQFGIDTRTVEAREATNNGYIDPGGVIARTSQQKGGFVRVGGAPRANPYANWGVRH
jgi:hypothetical protein